MKKLFTLFFTMLAFGTWVHAQQTVPFTENFDSWTNCTGSCNATCILLNGFQNVTGDDGSWITDNGGTSSGSTGPSVDHTQGNSTGKYLYYETSSPCYPNRTANLWSPAMNFSGVNAPQLEFWYHMLGATMGDLFIEVSTDGGTTWSAPLDTLTDDIDLWQKATINLAAYAGDTAIIRWRGVSTTSFTSDMAIDDVFFYDLLPDDAGIARIDTPTTPACNLGNEVWATLQNFGTNNLTSATVGWSVNGVAQTPVAWTGNLGILGDTLIQVGSTTIAPGDSICVWTSLPNGVTEPASGAGNDTACTVANLGLLGTYTVGGAGADFASIAASKAALDAQGVCGPVVFELADTLFQEQVEFIEVQGASTTNTIIYRSASGDPAACRVEWAAFLNTANYTFFLNGADYYHFEDITIAALGTTYGHVLEVNNGADWNSFQGCVLQGTPNNTTTSTFKAVVYSQNGVDNNNHFVNNTFENGSYAFYWQGNSGTAKESGTVFENNLLINTYYWAGRFYYQDAVHVEGNRIEVTTPYTGLFYRLYFFDCDGASVIANNVATGATNYGYGIYLSDCDATNANHARIYNNMISVGSPTSTGTSYGIYLTNSGYQDVAFNSIYLNSNGTNARAFYATSGGASNVWNNIFVNNGPGYAAYVNSPFSLSAMDYNNLYAPNGNVGYFSGAQSTFAAWQSASGFDGNSVSVDPNFYNPDNDLHVCNDTLDGAAFPLSFVERDIDGTFRAPTPDIGADEFVPIATFSLGPDTAICTGDTLILVAGSPSDTILWSTGDTTASIAVTGAGTYSVSVNSVCGSASDAVTVTISNLTYSGFLTNDANPIVCDGDTVTISATQMADSYLWSTGDTTSSIQVTTNGTYTLDIADNCGSGSESVTLTFETAPTASFTSAASFFTGIFTNTSTGAGTLTYSWDFGNGTGTSTLESPLYVYGDTGTYTVSLTVSNECGSNTTSGTVYIPGDTSGVFVTEQLEAGNVSVFPNPSNGIFNVGMDLAGAHHVTVAIQNLQGKEVAQHDLGMVSGEATQEFDLSTMAAGLYFVKIRVDEDFVVRKLIIE